jgi:hypothetical protein
MISTQAYRLGRESNSSTFISLNKDITDMVLTKLSQVHMCVWSYLLTGWSRKQIETFLAYHVDPVGVSQSLDNFSKTLTAIPQQNPLHLALRFLPAGLWQHISEFSECQRKTLLSSVATILPSLVGSSAVVAGSGRSSLGSFHRSSTTSSSSVLTFEVIQSNIVPFLISYLELETRLTSVMDKPVKSKIVEVFLSQQHPSMSVGTLDTTTAALYYPASVQKLTSIVAYYLFDQGLAEDGFTTHTLQSFLRHYASLFSGSRETSNRILAKQELWQWYESQIHSWLHEMSCEVLNACFVESPSLLDVHLEQQSSRLARLLHSGKHVFVSAATPTSKSKHARRIMNEERFEAEIETPATEDSSIDGIWMHFMASLCERLLQTHVLALWQHLSKRTDTSDSTSGNRLPPAGLYACLDSVDTIVAQVLRSATSAPASVSVTFEQRVQEAKRLSSMHQLYLQLFVLRLQEQDDMHSAPIRLVFMTPENSLLPTGEDSVSAWNIGTSSTDARVTNDSAFGDDVLDSLIEQDSVTATTKASNVPEVTEPSVSVTFVTDAATVLTAMLDLCPAVLRSKDDEKFTQAMTAIRQWLGDLLVQDLIHFIPASPSEAQSTAEKVDTKSTPDNDDWNDDWGDSLQDAVEETIPVNTKKSIENLEPWTLLHWSTFVRRSLFVHGHSLVAESTQSADTIAAVSCWEHIAERWSSGSESDNSLIDVVGRFIALLAPTRGMEALAMFMEDISVMCYLLSILHFHRHHSDNGYFHISKQLQLQKLLSYWKEVASAAISLPQWSSMDCSELSQRSNWIVKYCPTLKLLTELKNFFQWFAHSNKPAQSASDLLGVPPNWSVTLLYYYGMESVTELKTATGSSGISPSLRSLLRPLLVCDASMTLLSTAGSPHLQRRIDVLLIILTIVKSPHIISVTSWSAKWLVDALLVFWMSECLPRGMFSAASATQRLVQVLGPLLHELESQDKRILLPREILLELQLLFTLFSN